jgi:hypothetical protein
MRRGKQHHVLSRFSTRWKACQGRHADMRCYGADAAGDAASPRKFMFSISRVITI